MIKTDLIINDIYNSNCYVIQDQKNNKCIVIDPGSRDISNIITLFDSEKLDLDYLILTHSHFDHISGVAPLIEQKKAIIISSALCSEKIVDPVRNLSYFTDLGIIVSPKADMFIEDLPDGKINWNNNEIIFFSSPGHSRCSICIQIENKLFTGDTILRGIKTKITQPDGNRKELELTLKHIYETLPGNTIVYPGHGESFILNSQEISISLNK